MPTTGELIDVFHQHHMNVGSTDQQNSMQRRRSAEALQEVVDETWDESDWDFKQTTTIGSLAAGSDSVDAPSNFVTFGEAGGLYITVGGQPQRLEPLDPASLFALREDNRQGTGVPQFYTVSQQDATYLTQFFFDVTADTTYALRYYYDSTPPLVLDRPLAPTLAAGAGIGDLDGTYTYRIVFVGSDGSESEAGAVSASIIVATDTVSLTNIPVGNSSVVARKIYRPTDSDTTYRLVDTLNDNTTTTYSDNIADGSLGAVMTASATASSLKRVPEQYHRRVLLKGLIGKRGTNQGSGMAEKYEADYRNELAGMKARRKPGMEDLQRIGEGGLPSFRMH